MSPRRSRTNWVLTGIVALAAFFRFYRLDTLPPGFQFDQAFYVFDVIRLLQGQFHIFFAAPGGSEPLYLYLATVGVAIFGDTALGLKLTSALVGVLTVPVIYGMTRILFQSTRIAALTALFAAISPWHIFFSRYGERVTLLVLLQLLVLGFFWRALDARRPRDYALAGLFTALGLYTYVGARVIPVALLALTAYAAWNDRPNARVYLKGLGIALAVTAVLFLPLGVYFVVHPDQFTSHSTEVSIFIPHGNVSAGVGPALLQNAGRLLGMFFITGDEGALRNIPGRPVFDPFLGILFVAGILVLLAALFRGRRTRADDLDRPRAIFLLVWIAISLAISLFTDDAPNFVRTLPAMPAVMMVPAWGASRLWDWLCSLWKTASLPVLGKLGRAATLAAFGLIVLTSTALAYRDYFVILANDPATYYTFDTDKVETAEWIKQNAASNHLFLAPLWAQNGTISLLTRNLPLKSFESRDTIVLPSSAAGKDALFGFPFEQETKIQTMAARLGGLGAIERLVGSNGGGLLLIYRVPAANLPGALDPLRSLAHGGAFIQPQQIESANWGEQVDLLGWTLSPEGPGGRNLTVTLFLQALRPTDGDYTFSIKVRDPRGRTWGQEDKWPGNNSYATSQWSAGDVVVEKFYPGLSACAPAGNYAISVELYDPRSMQPLQLAGGNDSELRLGRLAMGESDGNRLADLEPAQVQEMKIGTQLQLMGYTLSEPQSRPGEDVSLALFWRGLANPGSQKVTLRLRDERSREMILAEKEVKVPVEGRGTCSLFDFVIPSDILPGPAALWVNDSRLAPFEIK